MKKKVFIGFGAVLGIALLAVAAFLAVRLMNSSASGSNSLLAGLGGGGDTHVQFMVRLTPAPELPVVHPEKIGIVASVQDNSIFVSSATNQSSDAPTPPGPYTEVVVSKDTKIYRDITLDNVPPPPSGTTDLALQQVVEPADLSSITPNSFVNVWGPTHGSRLVADTILVQGTKGVK